MRLKSFFKYNPVTDQYERVYPTRRERIMASSRQYLLGAVIGIGVFAAAYFIFDFPRERQLKADKEALTSQLSILEQRADDALKVMEQIAERDNNFYRVMMQSEPMTAAQRYAGLERQRNYEQLSNLSESELVKNVTGRLDCLDQMIVMQIKSYDKLQQLIMSSQDRIDHIPAIQPVAENKLRAMASGYGYRTDPIYGTQKLHEGMDFSAPIGTEVYATGNGIVVKADWDGSYGNLITIDHGYNYTTRYAHLSEILVKNGQRVKRGDLIGRIGNTGKSTGPHLHYEVRLNGAPQNPVNYYFLDLTPEQYEAMIHQAENAGHVMD